MKNMKKVIIEPHTQVELIKLYKQLKTNPLPKMSDITIEPFLFQNYGDNFTIIPTEIQTNIKTFLKIGKIYHFKTLKRNVMLHIALPSTSPQKHNTTIHLKSVISNNNITHVNNKKQMHKLLNKKIQHIFQKVFQVLQFFDNHFIESKNQHCSKELKIYLYLTDLLKKYPKTKTTEINEMNVNTGFTFGCSQNNEIYVYRFEEWEKVFIHECFHAFGLDYSNSKYSNLNQQINTFVLTQHDIQKYKDLRIYETYTETWATIICILNSLDCCFFSHNNKKINTSLLIAKFQNKLNLQIQWSIQQYIKLLKFHDCFNEKCLIEKEKVTLYAYYILKTRFLFYINDFFTFCGGVNEQNIIKFKKTNKHTNDFIDFINWVTIGSGSFDAFLRHHTTNTNYTNISLKMTIC
jgi:hypothetical protein